MKMRGFTVRVDATNGSTEPVWVSLKLPSSY